MKKNTDFWWWWSKKAEEEEVTFTLTEVLDLLKEVKEFNAGAIDEYLSSHVDKAIKKRLDKKKES